VDAAPSDPPPSGCDTWQEAVAQRGRGPQIDARTHAPETDPMLAVEAEHAALTRQLWQLVADEADARAHHSHAKQHTEAGTGATDACTTTRAEVARVWPLVVATFERLGAGVEALRTRLAQEVARREAAEAQLRALA
jgi:hypothetical protein